MDSTPIDSLSDPSSSSSSSSSSTIVPSASPSKDITPPAPTSTDQRSASPDTMPQPTKKVHPMQMKMQIQRIVDFQPRSDAQHSQNQHQNQNQNHRRQSNNQKQHQHRRAPLPRTPHQPPHNQTSLPIHFIPFSFDTANDGANDFTHPSNFGSTMPDLGAALEEQMLYYALPEAETDTVNEKNGKEEKVKGKPGRVAYKIFTYSCSFPGSDKRPAHGYRPIPIPGQFDPLLRPYDDPVIKAWPLNKYEGHEEELEFRGCLPKGIMGGDMKGKGKEGGGSEKESWISTLLEVEELVPVYVPVQGLRCWECRGGWWGEGGGIS